AEKAPSPNRRRKVLGRRKATKKASAAALAPMMRDISISRAKPAIRLTMVSPPIVPVAFRRFIWRAPPVPAFGKSGLAGDLADRAAARLRLLLGKLLEVEAAEID